MSISMVLTTAIPPAMVFATMNNDSCNKDSQNSESHHDNAHCCTEGCVIVIRAARRIHARHVSQIGRIQPRRRSHAAGRTVPPPAPT